MISHVFEGRLGAGEKPGTLEELGALEEVWEYQEKWEKKTRRAKRIRNTRGSAENLEHQDSTGDWLCWVTGRAGTPSA